MVYSVQITLFPELPRTDIRTIHLQRKNDLHRKVVDFLKTLYPNALMAPGLGEFQDTHWRRIKSHRKGYTKGQPDLLIFSHNREFDGLCFEFKTPSGKGVLSNEQRAWLTKLASHNWKCVVSNDYDDIVEQIVSYFRTCTQLCAACGRLVESALLPPAAGCSEDSRSTGSSIEPPFS